MIFGQMIIIEVILIQNGFLSYNQSQTDSGNKICNLKILMDKLDFVIKLPKLNLF